MKSHKKWSLTVILILTALISAFVLTACGEEDEGSGGHSHDFASAWTNDGDSHWHACSCGEKKDKTAHTWDEGTVVKEAACAENGQKKYVCTVCGREKTEAIPSLGHNMAHTVGVSATCTVGGNSEYWYCSVCDKYFSDVDGNTETTLEETVIAATGHEYATAWSHDNVKHWHECSCGEKSGEEAHSFSGEWSADEDSHWHGCICGAKSDSAEHTYSEEVISEPNCTDKGEKKLTCTTCGKYKNAEIPALGHNAAHIGAAEPTCESDGNTEYWYCSACNKYFSDEECTEEITAGSFAVTKLGHDYVNGVCTHCKNRIATEGLAYSLNEGGDGYILTGIGTSTATDISIPASYSGLPVTEIAASAFSDNTALRSVTFPSTIKKVGASAFSGCTGINGAYISDLKAWCGIVFASASANPMYSAATKTIYCNGKELVDLVVPEGVTFGGYNFTYCRSILTAKFPDSMTDIGMGTFLRCTNLKKINLPSELTTLGQALRAAPFSYCTAIETIEYTDLSKLTLTNNPFSNTAWFKNQPDGVIYLGDTVFGLKGSTVTDVVINEGTTSMISGCFKGNTVIKSVRIPSTIKTVAPSAFSGCTALQKVIMDEGVETISANAFIDCSALTEMHFPTTLKEIKATSFVSCKMSKLKVYIYDLKKYCEIVSSEDDYLRFSLTGIYLNNNLITDLVIPEGVETIGLIFRNTPYTSVTLASTVKTIVDNAFYNSKMTSVTLNQGLESIGDAAFGKCEKLVSIHIPSSVNSVGVGILRNCISLTEITASNNNYYFAYNNALYSRGGDYVNGEYQYPSLISGCSSTKSTYVGARSIAPYAFYGITKLTSITIYPVSDTYRKDYEIGAYAFSDCSSLTSVSFYSTTKLKKCGTHAFYMTPFLTQIGKDQKYLGMCMINWTSTTASLTIKNAEALGARAFMGSVNSLVTLNLNNPAITYIGEDIFCSSQKITTINFGGTTAEWNAIEKHENWLGGSHVTVYNKYDVVIARY